ncbi:MAG: zinc-dependent metalloprotease [Micrococcales bacterium]|nr:zinc-dependent metalloprotease [Micrococcales bacterium]
MSHEPPSGPPAWEDLLRMLLGPNADEAIRLVREAGIDLGAAADLPGGPEAIRAAMRQVQPFLAGADDAPVSWSAVHDLARQTAADGGDPTPGRAATRRTVDALTTADLWLDQVTGFDPAPGRRVAWSRAEWVEATLPAWRSLTEPIACALTDALGTRLADTTDESLRQIVASMASQVGQVLFGLQIGQAAGTLARDVFGTTDLGVPLVDPPAVAMVPTNVEAFAEGLETPVEEARLFLAVREAAAARLFAGAPWLRGWLTSAVDAYARGITIDPTHLDEVMRQIDPADPASLRAAVTEGLFEPRTTPAQDAALVRLETALALVEGWVDEVSAAAVAANLPDAVALREMMRRRRAAGGPAEHTFATLVGLQLRPRRLRDAARLWAAVAADSCVADRDAVWHHPDLIPGPDDLDDPDGYPDRRRAATQGTDDLDQALADILGSDGPSDLPPTT